MNSHMILWRAFLVQSDNDAERAGGTVRPQAPFRLTAWVAAIVRRCGVRVGRYAKRPS